MEKIILRGKKIMKNKTILNYDCEDFEWDDFFIAVEYFDRKDKNNTEEYIITGDRCTSPMYAGYIGKGGTFHPLYTKSLQSAVRACLSCADYGAKVEETKNGCMIITTYDHDGTNTFKIYKKQNGRRCNLRFLSVAF